MGKATIISEVGSGEYTVSLVYAGRARVTAWVADLTAKIDALETAIAEMDDGMEKTIAELRVQSFAKKKQYYNAKMPADRTVTIWCADKTEDLTGSVGTIEVPGERHDGVNIQPGHDANAVYDAARDGQLLPAVATSAEAAYFNRAIMPGWQKDKPKYRYATIVADSIDFDADTCDVCLDPAYSSQQNLDINQNQGFSECPSDTLAGFGQFCVDNPTHPTCINTEAPAGLHISAAQYETIKNINAAVNTAHDYETDQSGYGVGDHWAIMGPGDKGDCEDFALTKMQALIDAGFDVKNLQIGWGQTETGDNHAFLIIQTNNRGTLILDNRYSGLMQIGNVPYRFQGYQQAGQAWASYTTLLEAVPIEYMNCNAGAFADGDQVIVEFTDQDFSQPKVIGFRSDPQACISAALFFWTPFEAPYTTLYGFLFDVVTGAYTQTGTTVFQIRLFAAAGTPDSGGTVNFTGGSSDGQAQDPGDRYVVHTSNNQLSVAADAWAVKSEMTNKRHYHQVFSMSGGVYVVGGMADTGPTHAMVTDLEKYDKATDAWTGKADSDSRFVFAEFFLAGKGYVVGGLSGWIGSVRSSCRAYDPVTNAWADKTDHPTSVSYPMGFEDFATDKGYLMGGLVGISQTNSLSCREYNPVTNAWTLVADYPSYGCEGSYIEYLPPDEDQSNWYLDSGTCYEDTGAMVYGVPAAGGLDYGIVLQAPEAIGGGRYHTVKSGKYTPSTDTWAQFDQFPEKFIPFWGFLDGCGCAI